MSMLTLAISLTTSNLPWFMDLTFQFPMQQSSLQNGTLLTSPDTSTTWYHFCFGSTISFFLELLLCSSPVVTAYLLTRVFIFQCLIFLPFHTVHGVLKARMLKQFAIPFSSGPSLVAQRLKHLPPMQETRVWSLGWEGPLEKEMATHSSILAWRISWTEEPGRLQSMGSQRVGHDWVTSLSLSPVDHILSQLSTMTHPSWVTLTEHGS